MSLSINVDLIKKDLNLLASLKPGQKLRVIREGSEKAWFDISYGNYNSLTWRFVQSACRNFDHLTGWANSHKDAVCGHFRILEISVVHLHPDDEILRILRAVDRNKNVLKNMYPSKNDVETNEQVNIQCFIDVIERRLALQQPEPIEAYDNGPALMEEDGGP